MIVLPIFLLPVFKVGNTAFAHIILIKCLFVCLPHCFTNQPVTKICQELNETLIIYFTGNVLHWRYGVVWYFYKCITHTKCVWLQKKKGKENGKKWLKIYWNLIQNGWLTATSVWSLFGAIPWNWTEALTLIVFV